MKKFNEIFLLLCIFILLGSTSALASESTYTVKSGDSLWKIANEHGSTVNKLMQLNNLQSDRLDIGDKLILQANIGQAQNTAVVQPASGVYIVQAGDCLSLIAQRYGMSVETLKQRNQLSSNLINVGQKLQVTINNGAGLSVSRVSPLEVSRAGSIADGQRILDIARQNLGVPYSYGGTTPAGFDCSGFVQYVFKQCGYQLSRTASGQYQQGTAVSKSDLMIGDIVVFACNGGGIDHSGIYAGDNRFIHSSSPRSGGVITSSMSESYYSRSYVGARRIVR